MHCFCCSGKLLRHVSRDGLYWYCTTCRQAMPIVSKHDVETCHRKQLSQSDRPANANSCWIYIPLKPEQRDIA